MIINQVWNQIILSEMEFGNRRWPLCCKYDFMSEYQGETNVYFKYIFLS